jgi:hypothetical protein
MKEESAFVHLTSGALAGLLSDSVVHPIDTVRVRLQMASTGEKKKSATSTFFSILKNEGPSSLYKGFTAVVAGTVPGHALYFYGYEFSKSHINKAFKITHDNNPFVHFFSGKIIFNSTKRNRCGCFWKFSKKKIFNSKDLDSNGRN